MIFTVVYTNDDGTPACFGQFSTREAAQKFAEKIDRDLDEDRDAAGGGAGGVMVCQINRKSEWEGW